MHELADYDASPIFEGAKSFEEAAGELLELVLEVASGERTKAELLGQDDFGVFRIGPTF